MFEMTYGELFLFLWAVTASAGAWQWRSEAHERQRMLRAAAAFTKKLVEDDKTRDELRELFKTADKIEMQFGKER